MILGFVDSSVAPDRGNTEGGISCATTTGSQTTQRHFYAHFNGSLRKFSGHIISLAARYRVATCSGALAGGRVKFQAARNSRLVTLHAFSAVS